jgi:hypothetical protein
VLLLGALAVVLLVGEGRPLDFLWLPLVTGLAYLAAAAAGGLDGDLWGPALVVTGFGVGVGLTVGGPLGGELFAPVVLTATGAGAVLGALVPRVTGLSVAAAVLLSGVFYLLSERGPTEVFRSPLVYGALLALWGAWEMRPSSSASRDPITP